MSIINKSQKTEKKPFSVDEFLPFVFGKTDPGLASEWNYVRMNSETEVALVTYGSSVRNISFIPVRNFEAVITNKKAFSETYSFKKDKVYKITSYPNDIYEGDEVIFTTNRNADTFYLQL